MLARRFGRHHLNEYAFSGSVSLNNADMARQTFADLGAYLEQNDILWETYSPKELFSEAAELRTSMTR